eukprot:gene12232-25687_t
MKPALLKPFLNGRMLSMLSVTTKSGIMDWLEARGVRVDDMLVSITSKDNKYECRARKPIRKGETICTIPLNICLDTSLATGKFGSILTSKLLRTGDIGMLALMLLAEKSRGEKSKYFEYINALPNKPSGILSWTKEDIDELNRSTTRRVLSQVQAVEDDYKIIESLQIPQIPSTFLTFEAFKWAVGMVKSRHFFLEGRPILVP